MGNSLNDGPIPDDHGLKINRRVTAANLTNAGTAYQVQNNARWKLYHLQIKLVTTATVGNRLILVQIRDSNNNVVYEIVNSGTYGTGRTVAASTTERYELTVFLPGAANGVTIRTTMNGPYIMGSFGTSGGDNIFIDDTANIDLADQVSAEIVVEEWIDPGN